MAGESASQAIAAYQRDQRAAQIGSAHAKARRGVTRALRALHGPDLSTAPFPCHRVCLECGHTREPSTGGDPLRPRPAPVGSQSRCEACGEDTSVDVSYDSVATTLCESELAARSSTETPWLLICGSVFLATAMVSIAVAESWSLASFVSLAVAIVPSLGAVAAITRDRVKRRPSRPRRWHWVESPKGRARRMLVGEATSRSPLRAPMSGRECLAYEVAIAPAGVTPDSDADWVIREQRSTRVTVDGHHLEGNDVALSVEPATRQRLDVEPRVLARFLRERGITATRASYDVYETIVTPRRPVSLQLYEGSAVGTLRLAS